jgi:hypothetical protein
MKRCSDVIVLGKFMAFAEQSSNLRCSRKLIDRVSQMRMRSQGKNSTADAKSTYPMVVAIGQSII